MLQRAKLMFITDKELVDLENLALSFDEMQCIDVSRDTILALIARLRHVEAWYFAVEGKKFNG